MAGRLAQNCYGHASIARIQLDQEKAQFIVNLFPRLPLFEDDLPIACEDRVLAEISVVALGKVVAEVCASAFGAGQSRGENGLGHAAHGQRFGEPAAALALRG